MLQRVASYKGKWSPEQNPLLGLDLLSFDLDEDEASLTLKKKTVTAGASLESIELEMLWGGSSWLVADDNLFERRGYLSSLQ